MLGVEFDVFQNPEYNDIDDNHVGVDVNSLTSISSNTSGYWIGNGFDEFQELKLTSGVNYQVWVEYSNSSLNVTMAPAGMRRPIRPLISTHVNLSDIFLDEMYVGFTAATGALVQTHRILAWSFSNSNPRVGDELITSNLPSFVPRSSSEFPSKGFIISMTVATMFLICCGFGIYFLLNRKRRRRRMRMRDVEGMEDWELEFWPHRIAYEDIHTATKGFSDENLIGVGGIGKVYKGTMFGGIEVAVKCLSYGAVDGTKEFLAEISSLGRLKHRNLVGFRGWCKRDKVSLILVYDYMENGSLDKWVFDCDKSMLLTWEDRVRVLKNVAEGVLYLHEGWESRVMHRDIKASNVMLDKDMNGRLGDFGLARMHRHGQAPTTTRVMGTAGYMAPEIVRSGRASAQTDVFAFGVLVLEVVCGRRPVDDGKPYLVDWVWALMEKGKLLDAVDARLKAKGGFDSEEAERELRLGLLCAYPDPRSRPTMRQVLNAFNTTWYEEEAEGEEGMEMCLLDKIKTTAMWPGCHQSSHPTFNQIQPSISSSLSVSDMIVEGR